MKLDQVLERPNIILDLIKESEKISDAQKDHLAILNLA